MLQPRMSLALLLMLLLAHGRCSDVGAVRQTNYQAPGDVVLAAATFVREGTTTEFATGRVGRGRTQVVAASSSRVSFDRRQQKPLLLVFPTTVQAPPPPPTETVAVVAATPVPEEIYVPPPDPRRVNTVAVPDRYRTVEELRASSYFPPPPNPDLTPDYVDPSGEDADNFINHHGSYPTSDAHAKRDAEQGTEEVIKPAKVAVVQPVNDLPTFTVRHDFAPSGYSSSADEDADIKKKEKQRSGKVAAIFRGGKPDIPLRLQKLRETYTYHGFADFTTTIGDTVVIFMPSTSKQLPQATKKVTYLPGEEPPAVVTKVKTFMLHTPGMVTRTVTGHSLTMQTTVPTMVVLPEVASSRRPKAEETPESVYVVEAAAPLTTQPTVETPPVTTEQQPIEETTQDEAAKSAVLSREQELFDSPATVVDEVAYNTPEFPDSPTAVIEGVAITATVGEYADYDQGTSETLKVPVDTTSIIEPSTVAYEVSDVIEPSPVLETPQLEIHSTHVVMDSSPPDDETVAISTDEVKLSPTAPVTSFRTAKTQLFDNGGVENPIGLIKVIAGTEAINGTTTLFTSLIHGTIVNSQYAQIIHSKLSIFYYDGENKIEITPTSHIAPTTTAKLSDTSSVVNKIISDEPEKETTTSSPTIADEGPVSTTDGNTITTQEEEGETLSTLPFDVTTTDSDLSNEVETGRKISASSKDQILVSDTDKLKNENVNEQTTTEQGTTTGDDKYESKPIDEPTQPEVRPTENVITQIVPSTVYKTFTVLTTFFIPTEGGTTTSLKSREVITSEVIQATKILNEVKTQIQPTTTLITQPATTSPQTTERATTQPIENTSDMTAPTSPNPTTLSESADSADDDTAEVIYKTLYTTYTFYTTFFQGDTTSVASREQVETNIITSTIDRDFFLRATDPAVAGLFTRENNLVESTPVVELAPTSVGIGRPTTKFFPDSPQNPDDNLFSSVIDSVDVEKEMANPTPVLNLVVTNAGDDIIKTFYTTYTYFTTIFVDGETTVTSRTEVYTNVVKPSGLLLATPTVKEIQKTVEPELLLDQVEAPQRHVPVVSETPALKVIPKIQYSSTIIRDRVQSSLNEVDNVPTSTPEITTAELLYSGDDEENRIIPQKTPGIKYATVTRPQTQNVTSSVFETLVSSSGGAVDTIILNKENKLPDRNIVILDDQISSESNTESVDPAPTLLLQTSYTTYTYFTTVYKGPITDVLSRLETVTNVVTETLTPQRTVLLPALSDTEDDPLLPTTYFTTYTYWTTQYKGGSTVVTSREETVSNVVTPTVEPAGGAITTTVAPTTVEDVVKPTEVLYEPTTYYTTFTFFTTSIDGNSTVINSNLKTETNIVNGTVDNTDGQVARAVGTTAKPQEIGTTNTVKEKIEATTVQANKIEQLLPTGRLSTIVSTQVNEGVTTLFSTDVFGTYIEGLYAQVMESSTKIVTPAVQPTSTATPQLPKQPVGVVSLNYGRIVDADGVSTTFYTTKDIGTYIDQLYARVIESTSTVTVNTERQAALQLATPTKTEGAADKAHQTGLVRIIDGTAVFEGTTTFYESKVIGTYVNGRYAQIIESTSTFKVAMTSTPVPNDIIAATATLQDEVVPTTLVTTTSPLPTVVESSLGESEQESKEEESHSEEEGDDNEDDDRDSGRNKNRVKSRLTAPTRKRTFTPAIRPFSSRNRATFNPKRKTIAVTSATTITRTTVTPTVTATPAAKTGNRFANNRRGSTLQNNDVRPTAVSGAGSGGRRFNRVKSSSQGAQAGVFSSSYPGGGRGRSTARVTPTVAVGVAGSSRRGGGFFRPSTTAGRGVSSAGYFAAGSSSRYNRIRPTQAAVFGGARASLNPATAPSVNEETLEADDFTTSLVTDETPQYTDGAEGESPTLALPTTTEPPQKRNPLLRFRRPPLLRSSSTTPRTTSTSRGTSSPRRGGNNNRATTTTTAKPKPRPTIRYQPVANRARPGNGLFPPRGLFKRPEPEEDLLEENVEEEEDESKNEDRGDEEIQENGEGDFADEDDEGIRDNDYEGSERKESKAKKNSIVNLKPVQIRPFVGFRKRVKRQTDYGSKREGSSGSRSYSSRFRRPGGRGAQQQQEEPATPEPPPPPPPPKSKSNGGGRFTPRPRTQQTQQVATQNQRVKPTAASANAGRSQFTLREKDSGTPRYRRPTNSNTGTTPSRRRGKPAADTSIPSRPKPPRLRTQSNTNQQTETTYSRTNNRRYNGNTQTRRTSSRNGYKNRDSTAFDSFTYSQPTFDGTITVTHRIPEEVTIPVVNGKVTEYRNVVTARPSLEVLAPHQYTTSTGKDGGTVLVLTSEVTGTLPGGATEITQYLLRETPTTSIIFTPTTIRGRFTSFSHIIPSTVYDVEQVVNTVQPQIAANAPLANILLSQLLLGNLGGLQPNINPFLALNNQQQQQTPATPTTEFKTRATTYVTTLTKGRSTVIPLTFRGKEILTTIVDSSEEVITATEFITDTIVITPTATINNQLNSLLIPALLQAQILGNTPQTLPQQQAPNILPGLQITPDLTQPPKGLFFQEAENSETEITSDHQTRRSSNAKSRQRTEDTDKSVKDSELDVPDVDSIQAAREDEVRTWKPPRKKSTRNNHAERKPPDPPPAETSVVTLYVSGRRPGEFSTVVSTVTVGEDSSIRKREIRFLPKVLASQVPEIGSSFPDVDDDAYLDNYLMPAMNDLAVESSEIETQSLESIVGDVSRYISVDLMTPTRGGHNAKPSLTAHNTNPSLSKDDIAHSTNNKKEAGHFLSQGPAELAPLKRKVVKYSNRGLDLFEESSSDIFSRQGDSIQNENSRQRRSAAENSSPTISSSNRYRARVIKLRRPIGKSNNSSEEIDTNHNREVLTLSEAQQSEDVTEMHLTTIHSKPKVKHINLSDYGRRTVKIIRHPNSNNTNELSRKRIIVARKRVPIGSLVHPTPALISSHGLEEESPITQTVSRYLSPENIEASKTQGRRRIKVTKKRPVTHQPITPTTSSHRRRVIVTRRRPVHNEDIEDITPTSAVLTKIPAFTYATLSRQNKITSPAPFKPTHSPPEEVLENVSVESTEGQTEEYILDEYIPAEHSKKSESEIGTGLARGKLNFPNSFARRPSTTEVPKGFESDDDDESAGITSQTIDDSRGIYESNSESTEDDSNSPTTEVLKSKQNIEYEITTVAKDYLPINKNHSIEKPIRPVFSVGIVDSKTTPGISNNTTDTVFSPEYIDNGLTRKPAMITSTPKEDKTITSRPLLTTEESLIPSTKFYVTEENQVTTIKGDAEKVQNITIDNITGVSEQHSTEPIEMGFKSSEEGVATDGLSEGRDVTTQNVIALEGTQISPETTITTPLANGDGDSNTATTPESVTESTYDGPRFIRPTRFSVTRKPQRTRTTFPGQRRRTSTAVLTTSTPTTTEITPTKSTTYRFRKTSSTKTFGKSTTAPRFHGKSSRKQPDPTSVIDSPVADVTPTETQVLPEKLPIPETTIVTTDIDGTTSTIDEDLAPTATPTPQLTPTVQLLTSTRLRTFTYVVTRVAGDDVQVMTTTEVKPHVTIITRTVDQLIATALPTITAAPALDEGRALNVATRKMSNGVEVIVAGGRTTMPGVPTPTTLAATTLTDHVMLRMPQNDDVQPTEPPFDSDAFVTKTYLTTYTYVTTLVQDGKPLVTSSERVVSNVATEYADAAAGVEPTTGVVVQTESPALATSVLRTTYTYLTVGNEETSEKVVLNTVTAPPDVFQRQPAPPATNTYTTTMLTPQTLPGGEVVSSSKVITRLVVTRTEPPLEATMSTTDVVKTYFATYTYFSTEVDDRGTETVHTQVVTSTDVVTDKFYLTSKRTTQPVKATERPPAVITSQQVVLTASPPEKQFFVFATKTYLTTFTYFTTLLQDGGKDKTSTILNSRTKVVQNIVTETIPPSLLGAEYLDALRSSFRMESTTNRPIVAMATLSGGQEVKITAMEEDMMQQIQATSVGTNPTATVAPTVNIFSSMDEGSTTNVENIVTGSTIIFFDDEDQIDSSTQAQGTEAKPTPTLDATIPALNIDSILTSVINTGSATVIFPQTTTDSNQQVTSSAEVAADMPENPVVVTAANDEAVETVTVTTLLPTSTLPLESPVSSDKPEAMTKRPGTVVGPGGNEIQVSDLLSLGSLGINGLNALGPVFNAMAGLIQGNLYQQDSNRRNDTGVGGVTYVTPSPRIPQQEYPRPVYVPSRQPEKPTQDRSPIYIPVGGIAADYNRPVTGDIEIAESQNYEGHIHLNDNPEDVKWVSTDDDVDTEVSDNFPDAHRRTSAETNVILGRPTMEKPLLGNGIPISPGEVITANSDVIIGKPAVMGPRPPKINNEADDVPIGMRPPPIPSAQKWIQNVPHNKDEFIGPPPPLPPQPVRDNRPNHNNRPNGEHYRIHEKLPSPLRDQHFSGKRPQIQIAPHRTSVVTGSQTVLLAETGGSDIIQGNPIPNLPHHERIPIIHPADHTSLLVNIQPSQVAKVIIPHGSSTAHVFSAPAPPLSDNEFYDPSPFPLPEITPEFVGLGSLPQLGSVDGTQHGVGTVIEVHAGDSGSSVEAPNSDIGGNSDINVNIAPGQGIKVDVSSGHHENHRIQPSGIVLDAPLNPDRLHENRRPPVSQYMAGNHVRPAPRPTNPSHHQRFPPKLHRPTQYMTPPSPPPPAAFPRPHSPDLSNHFRHEVKHHPIIIPLNENNEPSQTITKTDEFSIKQVKDDEDDLDHAEEDVNTGEEIIQASNSMPVLPGQKPGIQHQPNGQNVFAVWSGEKLPTQHSNHEPIKPHVLPQYKPIFGSVHELAENVNRLQNSPNSDPNRPQPAVLQHGFHEIKEPPVTTSHQPPKEQFPSHVIHSSANEKEKQGNQNNDYVIVGHITPQVSLDGSRFEIVNKNEGNANNPILIGENVALSPKLEEILQHSSKNENNQNKVLTEKESTNIIHSSQNSKTKPDEQFIIHNEFKKPSDLYNDRTNIENLSPPPPKVNEFFNEQTFDNREPVINPSVLSYKPNFENNGPFEMHIGSPIQISSELRPPVLNVPHFIDKKPINKNKPLAHVPLQVNDHLHGIIRNISHVSVSLEDSINKPHIPGQIGGVPFNTNERFPLKDETVHRDKVPILTFDLQAQGSSPSPFTIRPIIDDSVVGLSPPPPRVTINSNGRFPTSSAESKDSTHRPAPPGGHRKPIPAQFPPPPYEFDRPPPSTVTEKTQMKIPPIDGPVFPDSITTQKTKLISKDEIEDEDDQVLAETSAGNKSPINHGIDIVYSPAEYTTYHPRPVKPLTPKQQTAAYSERTTTRRISTQPNLTTPKPITKSTPSSILENVIVGRPVIHNPPPPPPPPPPQISPTPTKAVQKDSTIKETITDQLWNIPNIIIGSEVKFETSSKVHNTPTIENTLRPTINVHYVVSGSKTVFDDFTVRPTKNQLLPSKVVEPNKFSQILTVAEDDSEDNDEELNKKTDLGVASSNENQIIFGSNDDSSPVNAVIPTHYLTHTHTLTVTTTETTVVSSEGHQPLTKTVVLTKTQTSTVVDTVTETQTLVRPTSVVQTVTTTVSTTIAQYPPGSPFDPENYPTFPTKLTSTTTVPTTQKPISELPLSTEASAKDKPQENKDPETFFVIVNDQQQKLPPIVTMPGSHLPPGIIEYETGKDEEEEDNGPPGGGSPQTNVLLSAGVVSPTSCRPDCSAAKNEVCQRVEGHMRCVCRPGFARMFLDRPCKPTYTYTLRLGLQRIGNEKLHYNNALSDHSSSGFRHLAGATGEGLDRLVMQSDLRDVFHGVTVASFDPVTVGPVSVSNPGPNEPGVVVSFHVQLSDNTDENRLKEVFKKSLRTNNFSLGGTEVYADQELIQHLEAEDFDECASKQYHDCSEHAHCFNLKGTYTCSCKEGYADLSENTLFPGRVCSAELIGCEKCHYHGTCHSRGDDQILCECFQWYAGETCHINLKALLIALVTIGAVLLVLLVVCIILTCLRRGSRGRSHKGRASGGTLDRRAMIQDTSSESSLDNAPLAYSLPRQQTPVAVFGKKTTPPKVVAVVPAATGTMQSMGFPEQRDRSLTVMIPRAKYRPVPPTSPLLTMSTFGAEEKRAIAQEHKLLAFLESGGKPHESHQMNSKRKQSNTTNQTSEPQTPRKTSAPRKQSVVNPAPGALVSAGFEVSATVGKVLDSDTETSAMVHNGSTLRTADSLHNTEENLVTSPKAESGVEELTVSEARSYDETTIQPPTKRLHSNYSSKQSSNNLNNDEGHTMAERDVGSTFMMPQSHLYTPDRGSDISNFDSL